MPNIQSVLKAEITRLVRKELKTETDSLRKSAATYRADIAALKRRVAELERALKTANRKLAVAAPRAVERDAEASEDVRFRASGMANNRKRLGLSAEDFGLLIGTSGQSVYAWEQGRSKPRTKNLQAIAALRRIGKREAAARLESLKNPAQ